jgi:hypothetical protein
VKFCCIYETEWVIISHPNNYPGSKVWRGFLYSAAEVDNNHQNSNGSRIDKLIRLGEAERLMREIMSPVPSRPTLISYIKKGVLKGRRIFNNYYLYESSLREFIEENKENL